MRNYRRSFTLIETLIYSALVSIAVSFVLLGVYQIIESRYRSLARTEIEEETNFLMRKIAWVLNAATEINMPSPGATSTVLSVNKPNFTPNPVVIAKANFAAAISYGGGEAIPLNSESVAVRELIFEGIGSAATRGVKVTLTAEFIPRSQLVIYNATSSVETTIYVRQE